MRPIAGYLLSTLAILTTALGCASSSEPRTWTPADYGSDYRATGMVRPKLISGEPLNDMAQRFPCYLPPDTAALVRIKCTLQVDGSLSTCRAKSILTNCEDPFANLVANLEKTYRYRPLLSDGQPKEVSFTYSLQFHGDGVGSVPLRRSNRPMPDRSPRTDVQNLKPGETLRQIAGSPPSFQQGGGICVPPKTTAVVSLSCIVGTDGGVSDCGSFPAVEPVGCDEAVANAITTIQETYRFRPIVRDGQPIAVYHKFDFQLLGEGVRPIQVTPGPE
ncbi:hypothetical protein LVJ94_38190 [Pendulispora rubella]|uniref:TonB C-terminal domain-containing protein n=1 Tax=Pendulispora rubella TaxID=2741070 RepID=A0ABZ2L0I2_9BACT